MSSAPTAVISVSVTTAPETETPLTLTALPAASTAKAPVAGTASPSSASSKVSVNVAPFTDAASTAGRTPSTLWVASAATPSWDRSTAVPPAFVSILPPLSSSVLATTATPSEASPSFTWYTNTAVSASSEVKPP